MAGAAVWMTRGTLAPGPLKAVKASQVVKATRAKVAIIKPLVDA